LSPQAQVPVCASICLIMRPALWGERSNRFFPLYCARTATWSWSRCGGPAGCARQAEQETSGVHNGKAAATVESGSGVHAGHDHASFASGGNDGADYLRSLGARISSSQSDEIKFMKRWLAARGEPVSMALSGMKDMDMSRHPMALMPGMLTPEQMEALRKANGAEFDNLFLTGMIQHHNGALTKSRLCKKQFRARRLHT
jgi:hypothetical protein